MKAKIRIVKWYGEWCFEYRSPWDTEFRWVGPVRECPIPWDELMAVWTQQAPLKTIIWDKVAA